MIIAGVVLLVGARYVPRRTAQGYAVLRHVDGFRRFIDESEKERARFAEQKNLFSEYLPYTIVFGATKKWARAFEGLDGEPPDTSSWYPHHGAFNALLFAERDRRLHRHHVGHALVVAAVDVGVERVQRRGFLRRWWRRRRRRFLVAHRARGGVGSAAMGPLTGVRVIELSGIGPGPFCGMLLSDMGAEVVRVERREVVTGEKRALKDAVVGRGRRSIGVDLKHPDGLECVLRLVDRADALIEGFRPGVTERLGLGPDDCLARNPRLVYGRMTGWGQDGPLASRAGHDINYISLAGVLAHIGRAGAPPTPPLNLAGDYGGGGMFLAFGIVCALLEARASGTGQVVDAAMVDGAAALMAPFWGFRTTGLFTEDRGHNLLDSGAHFYDVYETADGRFLSVGAIEPQFYAELLAASGSKAKTSRGRWTRARGPR